MRRSLHTGPSLGTALLLALQSAPGSAAAARGQAPVDLPTVQLQRIEVTGSVIRRVDVETAVPISVLRAGELRQQGVTNTEELIDRLSGNQDVHNSGRSAGSATGGASFADLRGIDTNKTLVLLSGRRLANSAIDGSTVDLNTIPFAAIDRAGALRDGASTLYSIDVIGRVISLIARESLSEGRVDGGYASSTHDGGGGQRNASVSQGFGELEEDRFNVSAVANYDRQERLGAKDRGYTYNYQPGRGLDYNSDTASPGNWSQGINISSPLAIGGCKGADLIPRDGICRQSLWRYLDLMPETEKTPVLSRVISELVDEHNVSLGYLWSRNDNAIQVGPGTLTGLQIDPGTAFHPGDGITPGPGNFVLDPSRPVEVN